MKSILGNNSMKTRFTHGGMECVLGERKCTFKTITVTKIDKVTKIMVNSKYFPIRGTTKDVGGISSANSKKKTVNESNILTHKEIFSPLSLGK